MHGFTDEDVMAAPPEPTPWPGNVRELENALERVLVLAPAAEDGASSQSVDARELDFLEQRPGDVADELGERALAHGLTLRDVEDGLLRRAMTASRGNLTAAARRVGLTRRAFEYRIARARGPVSPIEGEVGGETSGEARGAGAGDEGER